MSKGIQDLGIGLGYVYITEPDGSTVLFTVDNTCDNVRNVVKPMAVASAALSANKSGIAEITIDAVSGTGNITAINVGGVNQIASVINVSGKTNVEVAEEVRNAINAYSPAGVEYRSITDQNVIKLMSDESAGSSVNGDSVALVSDDPANIIYTATPVDGASSTDKIYDESCGYRFFIDADYAAATGPGDCACAGEGVAEEGDLTKAIEITDYLIIQGIQTNLRTVEISVTSGYVSVDRQALLGYINLDTESMSATDDLDTIDSTTYSDGDILVLYGTDVSRVITVKNAVDNIFLQGGIDFETGDTVEALGLQKRDNAFYEIFRTKNTFAIADGSITEIKLANDVISTVKLQDGSVTEPKLAADAVTTTKIQDGAVTASKLADGAIPVSKLDSQVTTELITIPVSFETAEQGDYKIRFPYDCEVLEAIAYVTKNIEATDDATIIMKDNTSVEFQLFQYLTLRLMQERQ
jgi:hypothetical protein